MVSCRSTPSPEACPMYRIRMCTGDEAHFAALEEFCAGVRAGIVSPDALIYHARAEKWIPVNVHPHYKLAFENGHRNSNGHPPTPSAPPADQAQSSNGNGHAAEPAKPASPATTVMPRL